MDSLQTRHVFVPDAAVAAAGFLVVLATADDGVFDAAVCIRYLSDL
jgi:hypothetical protein